MTTIKPINIKSQPTQVQNVQKKTSLLDKFETKQKNAADMNDCVAVPRTIFKGYLGIMFGTSLATIAGNLKSSKIKTGLNIVAIGLSALGTWCFARPYVLKNAVPTVKANTKAN